jgi:gluconolactonase
MILAASVLLAVALSLAWLLTPAKPIPSSDPEPVALALEPPSFGPQGMPELLAKEEPVKGQPTAAAPPGLVRPPKEDKQALEPVLLSKPPVARLEPRRELPPAPARVSAITVKRRRDVSEDELLRQIGHVTEVLLDHTPNRLESRQMVALAKAAHAQGRTLDIGPMVMKERQDLVGLPMRMGDACHLNPSAAEHLEGSSLALRGQMSAASQPAGGPAAVADTRPDPKKLHQALNADGQRHNKWLRPEAVPALQQLLMAENEAIRDVLVDQLARIDGPRASAALAQRALFDLNADIRKAALAALRERPVEEYQQALLDGFRHPWPAVADHAAEALVALGLKHLVPALVGLLDQPNPTEPYVKPNKEGLFVRDMVRINHLHNCLLCHAASLNTTDRVRGRVPPTDQPLPPPFTRQYYADTTGTFVRADITYLQQDFSEPLPVKNPGKWPEVQRYDFLVRERPATVAEVRSARLGEPRPAGEHHKALLFALRELTGTDPGPSAEDWKRLFLGSLKVSRRIGKLQAVAGLAADAQGRLFVSDAGVLLHAESGAKPSPVVLGAYRGLALDARGRLLACGTNRVVAMDPKSGAETTLADRYHNGPFNGPLHLAADHQGGVYFTDMPALPFLGGRDNGAVYYVSAQGVVTRLAVGLSRPTAVALSPDARTLYLLAAGSPEVMAYPLEGTGLPGAGRVLCRLDVRDGEPRGGHDIAVDVRGNLFVTNPGLRAVQVFNPQGARLGQALLPDAPLSCAAGAADGRSVYVATRTAVYAVQVDTDLASR